MTTASDATTVEPEVQVPEPALGPPKDSLAHIMCCSDEDIAMCGGRLTGKIVEAHEPAASCLVCEDLWSQRTYCPKGGQCTWDEQFGCPA